MQEFRCIISCFSVADVLKRLQSPSQKGAISPATTPTSAQVDSHPFSETSAHTSRPTLPATSFHSDSPMYTQSPNQTSRQWLSPSPSPLTSPRLPRHDADSSSSSNSSPSDSMMLSGIKPPNPHQIKELLEDYFSSDSSSSDSGMLITDTLYLPSYPQKYL